MKIPFGSARTDRIYGALLGLAVGDALGTTLEFSTPKKGLDFTRRHTGPHKEMTGKGPFKLLPGQVTDDTHMACCLARSLMEMGKYDRKDVFPEYMDWSRVAFDVGNQTRASLRFPEEGENHDSVSKCFWVESGGQAAGNGSLMRTAPIGVFFADDVEERRRASMWDSAITHFDPRCQLACAVINERLAEENNDDLDFSPVLG